MRRPLCTVIAAFILFTSLLKAQESKSPSFESEVLSTSGDAATITMLLQQSHDIGQQLPAPVRLMNLLAR